MKQSAVSKHRFVIVGILIFSFLLRLPLLNGSFWLDEAAQALESARPLVQQLDIAYDFQPPLLHLITHFALYISRSEWWLRTFGALIPGIISIWATYQIGKKLADTKTAIWASLLMATNSFHVFYSQELRPYALPALFASLSWLVLLSWQQPNLNKPLLQRHRLFSKYALYTLLTLLGLYSSYLYPFLIISQAVYILLLKRNLVSTYFFHAIFWVLGFLPWLPSLWEQFQVGGQLRSTLPGWEQVVSIDSLRSIALVFGKFTFGVLDLEFTLFFFLGMMLVLLPMIYSGALIKSKRLPFLKRLHSFLPKNIRPRKTALKDLTIPTTLLIWLLVPLATAWLVSLQVPVLRPKRVLFLLPAFYLLISFSAQSFPHKKVSQAFLGILLTLNIYGLSQYYLQPRLQREDWRSLHANITHLYNTDAASVFSFNQPFAPWIWYNQQEYPSLATGSLSISDSNLEAFSEQFDGYTYLLVFDYLRDLTDPDDKLLKTIEDEGYQAMDFYDQTSIGFVRIYARPVTLSQNMQ